jgi:hypothetical protein
VTRAPRGAITLVEILVASVILVMVAIPMLGIFQTSRQSIMRTDRRREIRHITSEILAHAARQPLHELWDEFGPGEVVGWETAGRMKHRIADYDATGRIVGSNPLGFSQDFVAEMLALGLEARLHFEFYSRNELGLNPRAAPPAKKLDDGDDDGPPRPVNLPPVFGILHMQAGYARVDILDRAVLRSTRREDKALLARWAQPIMCPAVVGRPGLRLASCPAVNPKVKAKYVPLLAMREGWDD